MKVYKKSASVIRDALNFWKAEDLVTEEQANKLSGSLEIVGFDWKKFSILVTLFSIFFLLIASAGFIDELRKSFESNKIIVCFVVTAAAISFYGLGLYGKAKWPEKFYSNEGMFFLGVLFTPCAILMFFTVLQENEIKFDITGDYFSNVVLISYVIYAVLGLLLDSKLIWCFSLLSLGYWVGMKTGYLSDWDAYYLGMNYPLRFVLFGLLLIGSSILIKLCSRISSLHRTTLVTGLLYLLISLWIVSIFGNYGNLDSWHEVKQVELLHWSLIFTLVAGVTTYHGIKYNDSVTCSFGVTFLIINLYTRYFEYFWGSIHGSLFYGIFGISLWILAIKAEQIFNLNVIYNKKTGKEC